MRTGQALAAGVSDRHTGIGSDGLILAGESAHADVRMTMFNADGSEGQMCGNGVRCLVSFAVEQGIVPCERDRPSWSRPHRETKW